MSESSTSSRRFSLARFLSNTALACVGLTLVASMLHARGPMATSVTLDRERVERQRKTCEVLFAGPSYVISQVIPKAFDAEAKRLGRPMRSCIFGATGLRGTELRVHLQELLRRSWPRLKLIVVDVTLGDDPRFDEVNWYKPRFIQWHTADSMPWILDYYRKVGGPLPWPNLRAHTVHFVANYANLGVGLERLSVLGLVPRIQIAMGRTANLPELPEVVSYNKDLRAREHLKKQQARAYRRSNSAAKHKQNIARLVREKRVLAERGVRRGSVFPDALRALARSHGKDIIFIHAPVWRSVPGKAAPPPSGEPIVLHDFNDPERYPSLYTRNNRGRTHHVSWYGGLEYSKLLAQVVIEHQGGRAGVKP